MLFLATGIVDTYRHDVCWPLGTVVFAAQEVNPINVPKSKAGMMEFMRQCGVLFISWGPVPDSLDLIGMDAIPDKPRLEVVH